MGGKKEWELDIKQISDIILNTVGINDSIVKYKDAEPFTTEIKTIDCTRAEKELKHNPIIDPKQGISKTVKWMKERYRL